MRAYSLAYYQIQGPDWLSTIFVVDAVMSSETTPVQSHAMLQHLLVERFKMAAHRETKQLSGYSRVVAKGGPKLKVRTENSPHAFASAGPPPKPGQRPPPI
jgi:uncharacterized protein (TIGR03435 family)